MNGPAHLGPVQMLEVEQLAEKKMASWERVHVAFFVQTGKHQTACTLGPSPFPFLDLHQESSVLSTCKEGAGQVVLPTLDLLCWASTARQPRTHLAEYSTWEVPVQTATSSEVWSSHSMHHKPTNNQICVRLTRLPSFVGGQPTSP